MMAYTKNNTKNAALSTIYKKNVNQIYCLNIPTNMENSKTLMFAILHCYGNNAVRLHKFSLRQKRSSKKRTGIAA